MKYLNQIRQPKAAEFIHAVGHYKEENKGLVENIITADLKFSSEELLVMLQENPLY